MKMTALLFVVIAIIAAVVGFKVAIGLVALIAKVCFVLALIAAIGVFIAGLKAGEKIGS